MGKYGQPKDVLVIKLLCCCCFSFEWWWLSQMLSLRHMTYFKVVGYSVFHWKLSLTIDIKIKWPEKSEFSSVAQTCLILCNPMDCSTPAFPVHHQLPELTQSHVHWVGDPIQTSHPLSPLLLPPLIFPSIRVFSNESVLLISCPKYWSFSFSISPSNEYSGLISFKMEWLDFFAIQGTLRSLL